MRYFLIVASPAVSGGYVVVQFYPWFNFYFPLFLCMVKYDNGLKTFILPWLKTKKNKNRTKDEIVPQQQLHLAIKSMILSQKILLIEFLAFFLCDFFSYRITCARVATHAIFVARWRRDNFKTKIASQIARVAAAL